MSNKKGCSTKCYCNKNAVSCQHILKRTTTPQKTIYGKRGLMEKSMSTSSSKSQFEFIKLKRDYDALTTAEKAVPSQQEQMNFSRRNSTSTVDSLATPSSASSSNGSNCSCHQKNQQKLMPVQVNKLKYSDQRTLYEHCRLAGEQHGNLKEVTDSEKASTTTTKTYLFDPAYLKALQEFRLNNRSECFS